MTKPITIKNKDSAGGTQLGGGQDFFFINGEPVIVKGDPVAGHGLPPHSSPKMVGASSFFYLNGKAVCRKGDKASCGHGATGQDFFQVD